MTKTQARGKLRERIVSELGVTSDSRVTLASIFDQCVHGFTSYCPIHAECGFCHSVWSSSFSFSFRLFVLGPARLRSLAGLLFPLFVCEFVGRRSAPLAAQLYRSGILLLGHGLSITAVSAGRTQWPDSAIG